MIKRIASKEGGEGTGHYQPVATEKAVSAVIAEYHGGKEQVEEQGNAKKEVAPPEVAKTKQPKTTADEKRIKAVDKLLPSQSKEPTSEKPVESPKPRNLTSQATPPEPQRDDIVPGLPLSPEAVARLEEDTDASTPGGASDIEDSLDLAA